MQTTSIRNNLLISLLVPLICLCLLSTAAAFYLANRYATEACDDYLLNSADSIGARVTEDSNGIIVTDLPASVQAIIRHMDKDKFYYQILDESGHRLTGDAVLPLPRRLSTPTFRNATVNGATVRMCKIPVRLRPGARKIWVQVAETINSRQRLLEKILFSIVFPQIILIISASIAVWSSVGYSLKPLYEMARLLNVRNKNDLSPVELSYTPKELEPMINSLNTLLVQAGGYVESQRQFISNAAHQLRTPMTALKTYIDHAQRVQNPVSMNAVLKDMSDAANRTTNLIGKLLTLARAEVKAGKEARPTDLTDSVTTAATHLVQGALARGIQLSFDMPENGVEIQANPGDIEELVANLLDNAIKYTPEAGSVWVKVEQFDDVRLSIEDNGPGIPDCEKKQVFQRFYRGNTSPGLGSGLGLAISSEIAVANNGKIEIADRPGGGTAVYVTFPCRGRQKLVCAS